MRHRGGDAIAVVRMYHVESERKVGHLAGADAEDGAARPAADDQDRAEKPTLRAGARYSVPATMLWIVCSSCGLIGRSRLMPDGSFLRNQRS